MYLAKFWSLRFDMDFDGLVGFPKTYLKDYIDFIGQIFYDGGGGSVVEQSTAVSFGIIYR